MESFSLKNKEYKGKEDFLGRNSNNNFILLLAQFIGVILGFNEQQMISFYFQLRI